MKQKKLRSLSAVLLIGWCLIFLRCETTEKSMVRALYLAQKEQSITVGLLYQAPEAACFPAPYAHTLQAALPMHLDRSADNRTGGNPPFAAVAFAPPPALLPACPPAPTAAAQPQKPRMHRRQLPEPDTAALR